MSNATAVTSGIDERLVRIEDLRLAGALSQALTLCKDVIEALPRAPDPLRLAAAISRDSGWPDQALTFLDRAAALDPSRVDIHCERAQLLRRSGDTAGAGAAYGHALEADAACADAHRGLAALLASGDRLDDAIYHLELAVALDPADIAARDSLARLLDLTGNAERAAPLREETMRRARLRLAEDWKQLRTRTSRAPARVVERNRRSWVQTLLVYASSGTGLAKHHESQGDLAAALDICRETLRVLGEAIKEASSVDGLPRNAEALSQAVAQCHHETALLEDRQGNFGGAVYHLEEALRASPLAPRIIRDKLGEIVSRDPAATVATICDAVAAHRGKQQPPAALPVTRWDFFRHATGWLDAATRSSQPVDVSRRRRVAVAAFTARHIQWSFALACVLLARGHAVDLVWLPALDFDRSGEGEPAYEAWDERLLAGEMALLAASELPPALRLIDLRNIVAAPLTPELEAFAERQALIDLSDFGRARISEALWEPAEASVQGRVQANLFAARRCLTYFAENERDQVVLFNGGLMEYSGAFHAARLLGVNVIAWDYVSQRRDACVMTVNCRHADADMQPLWRAGEPHRLSSSRRERVATWLLAKGGGRLRPPAPRGQVQLDERGRRMVEQLGLDPRKPIAVLFPDRTPGPATPGHATAFGPAREWIVQTIAFFDAHREWQLILRDHPQERTRGSGTLAEQLSSWPLSRPPNMRIVESDDAPSAYRLLEAAQLGLYHTDLVGLEMAMLGIPAITPARPPYSGLGFTREVADKEAYFGAIAQLLAEPENFAMSEQQIEQAWCCADLYLNDVPKPFPWTSVDFWHAITDGWPMERVLSPEGRERFGQVFSAFGGEADLTDGIVGRLT